MKLPTKEDVSLQKWRIPQESGEAIVPYYKVDIPLSDKSQIVLLHKQDHLPPEAMAACQSFYSRSTLSVSKLMKRVLGEKGFDGFMDTYYIKYGDKSIGDCGSIYLFIENVSMLAAKAIQDWWAYNGQESSTRYIDFSKQVFFDPLGTEKSAQMLKELRDLHMTTFKLVQDHVLQQRPQQEDESDSEYKKAVRARSFDIARSTIPAGALTNLSWHVNLRQLADKLDYLRHHPLEEIRAIAAGIESLALVAHPHAFKAKRYTDTEQYRSRWMRNGYLQSDGPEFHFESLINLKTLGNYREVLWNRPEKTELPRIVGEAGIFNVECKIDYGSYRDIQRHRSLTQSMPLLTANHGYGEWYLKELPIELRKTTEVFLTWYKASLQELQQETGASPEIMQYYIPMGYQIPLRLSGPLPAWVYTVELRTSSAVHPTLQKIMHRVVDEMIERYGDAGLRLHIPDSDGSFSFARGQQDIMLREK